MKKDNRAPVMIHSITEWHRRFGFPQPQHPLISLINHSDVQHLPEGEWEGMVINFYIISVKKSFKGKMRYGKNYYDFDEGTMGFLAPGQVISIDEDGQRDCEGWSLIFHPDFIRGYPLAKSISGYGFFSYDVNEALHLSDKEDKMLSLLLQLIQQEYHASIDQYSQGVMVAHLEVLLHYANRFYQRQFITRKTASSDLMVQLDDLLTAHFAGANVQELGLPTVQYLAKQLNVSPNYLGDALRSLTGQSTQQHIHNKLIEKAKEVLSTTRYSVSEIAYQLGFEYPQSFSKLFKSKTSYTPQAFRQLFG